MNLELKIRFLNAIIVFKNEQLRGVNLQITLQISLDNTSAVNEENALQNNKRREMEEG